MKLGSHVSLKAPDFLLGSLQEAKSYGADCLMFYTGAPQNTIRVELSKMRIEEANRFDSDLIRICHAPYVLNLANPDDSKRAFAISFLQEEANRAFRLGARCIVLHPGSSLGQGFEEAARRVVSSLDSLSLPIPIALETMAGKGSEIGRSLEEIAYLLSISKQDLRVCLDTCHLSDAGYDLSDPDAFLDELERFFPLEKVAVIHAKMDKNEIENVMNDFYSGQIDVLVATSIVENGIDVSNANTIIIDEADHFGLADLYQLKGRVGRGARIAYAYLLYKPHKNMTESAGKRLKAIQEFTELGSGYKIAMRDLAIRGAGDLLGPKQSGFIDNVGIDAVLLSDKSTDIFPECNPAWATRFTPTRTVPDVLSTPNATPGQTANNAKKNPSFMKPTLHNLYIILSNAPHRCKQI